MQIATRITQMESELKTLKGLQKVLSQE